MTCLRIIRFSKVFNNSLIFIISINFQTFWFARYCLVICLQLAAAKTLMVIKRQDIP